MSCARPLSGLHSENGAKEEGGKMRNLWNLWGGGSGLPDKLGGFEGIILQVILIIHMSHFERFQMQCGTKMRIAMESPEDLQKII